MGVRVISNRIPQLREQLADWASMSITFGYQGDTGQERYESGLTVAHNAAIQEFGGGDTPSRPFLRETLNMHGDAIREVMKDAAADVANLRKDAIDAMLDAANQIHGLFLETLDTTNSWAVANAPRTVEAKGHDHPLMGGAPPDDGPVRLLRENLTWAIRRNGTIIAEGR